MEQLENVIFIIQNKKNNFKLIFLKNTVWLINDIWFKCFNLWPSLNNFYQISWILIFFNNQWKILRFSTKEKFQRSFHRFHFYLISSSTRKAFYFQQHLKILVEIFQYESVLNVEISWANALKLSFQLLM